VDFNKQNKRTNKKEPKKNNKKKNQTRICTEQTGDCHSGGGRGVGDGQNGLGTGFQLWNE